MIGVTDIPKPDRTENQARPVDLRRDLRELADLIELVFRDRMDASGRAAIREMRYLSQIGIGLNLLKYLNELTFGISLGYVWIQDGKLVGNVSIYPANWPKQLGTAWMIANVAVHPDYRRQGIARKLMLACMDLIQRKGGQHAILQVDYDNHSAIDLYESLDFVRERAFTQWQRSALVAAPPTPAASSTPFITRPRRSDWRALHDLVRHERPNELGGLGWLNPVYAGLFRPSIWRGLREMVSFNSTENLIVQGDAEPINALLMVERGIALSRTRLTLVQRGAQHSATSEALLAHILRRYRSDGFIIEHPHDDSAISELLETHRFRPSRTVWHMRYDYH